jgi:hypothetical protein
MSQYTNDEISELLKEKKKIADELEQLHMENCKLLHLCDHSKELQEKQQQISKQIQHKSQQLNQIHILTCDRLVHENQKMLQNAEENQIMLQNAQEFRRPKTMEDYIREAKANEKRRQENQMREDE